LDWRGQPLTQPTDMLLVARLAPSLRSLTLYRKIHQKVLAIGWDCG
jgi:hypothetical protein